MEWLPHPLQIYTRWFLTNVYILWMGIWIHHHAVTTTFVYQDAGSQLKSSVTGASKMKPLCSGWCSTLTWNGSHIHFKYIQGGYWQCAYAVDGDMDPASCCYHHIFLLKFRKSAEIFSHWCKQNDTTMEVSMLLTHMEWAPHPLQIYTRCLTMFTCSRWVYGSIIMLLPPHLFAQILEVSWNLRSLLGTKWYPCIVVDALNPHKMVSTSTQNQNICKVIDNLICCG